MDGTPIRASGSLGARLRHLLGLLESARPSDWWEFKIPPLLATTYATSLVLQIPVGQLCALLPLVLFALLPGAAFVSVLNDLTDLEDDLRVAKANRMVGRSSAFAVGALAACLLPGVAAAWLMRHDALTLIFYALNWLAFTLYSTPPVRLKIRGGWGVAMDAAGAHLLPTLWTSTLLAEATGHTVPVFFLCSLGFWASALGLRGILWHQLYDREKDIEGHVTTFATERKPESIRRFVAAVTFPVEVAALAVILAQIGTPWAWLILAAYLIMEGLICRYVGLTLILVQPTPNFRMIFSEYYQLWFPLTFLLAMTPQSMIAVVLIALQLALFPLCFYRFLQFAHYLLWLRAVPGLGRKFMLLTRRGAS